MSAIDVCVLGSLNLDLVVRAPRLPAPGETLLGGALARYPGGKGANQAVAAARAGARTALCGALGRDAHGDELASVLASEGLELGGVRRVDLPTGVAVITVADGGENTIVVAPGANRLADAADCAAALSSARVLVAQLEVPLAAVETAFTRARASEVLTLLNAAPAREQLDTLLGLCDVLVVNRGEARALLGGAQASDEALARGLARRGPRVVVVTLGAEGAMLVHGAELVRCPPFAVHALDTTGAGDAFVGAFAAQLARGAEPTEALVFGCAAGALAASRHGALPALARAAEIEQLVSTARG